MKLKSNITMILGIAIFLFLLFFNPYTGHTKDSVTLSTLENRTSLVLTIYNQNFALVREKRKVTLLPKEEQELIFQDVPVQIEPDTVFVKTEEQELNILEQKFEYDLITFDKLMEEYVGRKVKILEKNEKTGEKKVFEAELVSYNNNQPIYRIEGEIYLGYPGTVILPKIPEQLMVQPTLRWLLQQSSGKAQEKLITVSYLTRGLNWKADYVLQLLSNEKNENNTDNDEDNGDNEDNEHKGNLLSWVTIENQTGALFEEAKINLVAGEVQRVTETPRIVRRMKMAESFEAASAPFQEETFSEYHLYVLERTSTLKDQQTTQIPFIKASLVPVEKEFVFWGTGIYNRRQKEFSDTPKPVQVYLKLANKKEQNLGLPLPQGSIKVYQHDQRGNLEFIGEDLIKHTPEGEPVRIRIGDAFDVVGVQKQMDWEKISARVYESSWQVTLRNRKDKKIVVRVLEPVGGEWKIVSSSRPYKRLEARKIEFSVPLPSKAEKILTYRIRVEL